MFFGFFFASGWSRVVEPFCGWKELDAHQRQGTASLPAIRQPFRWLCDSFSLVIFDLPLVSDTLYRFFHSHPSYASIH
jgi:hypothetical protein